MSESVRQNLPAPDDHITVRPSPDQLLVIRKAAELIGWTVTDFVLSAALDRAERDLYEHAAALETATPAETDPTGPYTALLLALS
ncbi:DUF1778 domain-containing protein [Actinomadura sp. KC06]|uniref:type II toxin -antitoxin system TacA 1-like antitoxin n=1 Tax=Actinomadura sp. KC06 TaxID=2530369 RepID=UPI0014048182|nr:DUF1778 domain-containing protein [Actinomadura sp. KC06]